MNIHSGAWKEALGCAVMGNSKIGGAGQNQREAMCQGISIELGWTLAKEDEAE